jgi:membrane-bound lytic murein transglycosylase B
VSVGRHAAPRTSIARLTAAVSRLRRPRSARIRALAALGLLTLVVAPSAASTGFGTATSQGQAPNTAAAGDASVIDEPLPPNETIVPADEPTASAAPHANVKPTSASTVSFAAPASVGALGIPMLVLQAYYRAADRIDIEQPSCHLAWWLLAGIGHTESGHAEGGRLYADGTTRGRILGPVLNGGIAGDAVVRDTDHGVLDGDPVYDRAVGPMQFIPGTWQTWGADGNNDGRKDPNNIFDATLAAGRYLCTDARDLAHAAGLASSVLSYNNSAPYLANVLAWGRAYQAAVSLVPGETTPVVSDVVSVRPPLSSRPPVTSPTGAGSAGQGSSGAGATPPSGGAPSGSISNVGSGPAPSPSASPTGSTTCAASPSSWGTTVTPDGGSAATTHPAPSGTSSSSATLPASGSTTPTASGTTSCTP